jgi:mono/diheme cytochrome c family protein
LNGSDLRQLVLAVTHAAHMVVPDRRIAIWVAALCITACGANSSFQIMGAQPRYRPLAPSTFFPDGIASRPLIPDTVARGELRDNPALFTGEANGQVAAAFPFTVTQVVLLRGQERYNVFCAPCHGRTGDGNGMIVQRGFPHAASLHSDRLRAAAPGYLFQVATNGFGAMPPYSAQIPERDRWAIVAYIRALQLSQHATLDDVPPDQRPKLGTAGGGP